MKIETLVNTLNKIKDERGNLDVRITSLGSTDYIEDLEEVHVVEAEEINNGAETFVYFANCSKALEDGN